MLFLRLKSGLWFLKRLLYFFLQGSQTYATRDPGCLLNLLHTECFAAFAQGFSTQHQLRIRNSCIVLLNGCVCISKYLPIFRFHCYYPLSSQHPPACHPILTRFIFHSTGFLFHAEAR